MANAVEFDIGYSMAYTYSDTFFISFFYMATFIDGDSDVVYLGINVVRNFLADTDTVAKCLSFFDKAFMDFFVSEVN